MGKQENRRKKASHGGAKKVDRSAHWKYGKSSGKPRKETK